jgi:hypothetical protein
MKRTLEGPVVVLPREDVIDVFTGKGWSTHSVFKVVKGFPKFVGGSPLTEEDFKTLKKLV